MTVHIFQIGCQDFGKYGFEKLVDKQKFFPEDVVLEGVCEKDFEFQEEAERFAEASGVEPEFYEDIDEMYKAAQEVDGTVLIYDAGPVQMHSDHIQRSLRNDFYHLSEKPPSLDREAHIQERKLAAKHNVHYKVDFIERENPVVKKMLEIIDKEEIENIKVFRQSSTGVQRLLEPIKNMHVNEGCVLDKMIHDIYVMDLTDNLELESVQNITFMPKDVGSEKFLRIDGGYSQNFSERNALGRVSADFSTENDVSVEMDASWLGASQNAKKFRKKIREIFGDNLINSQYREVDNRGFLDEQCCFFVIEADKRYLGDMLNKELYDMDLEEHIELDKFPRSQLYRVLERAIVDAAGHEVGKIEEDSADKFVNALFDVQDAAGEKTGDVFEELDQASEKIRSMLVSDKTELDKDDLKGVAS